jgi:CheY-like chemotaxis protein
MDRDPSPATRKNLRIVIFNDGPDLIATMTRWLQIQGHRAWSAQLSTMRNAHTAAAEFIGHNRADVVVFDVGIPYACNWDFGQVLQLLPGADDVPFVFTTTNKFQLELLVGRTTAYQITGTAENLDGLTALIHSAAGRAA